MTDSNHEPPTDSADARNRWVEDAQAALDRTVEAMRSAWDATRESRMSALDSAKQAASELGTVLEKGIAAAKERWSGDEAEDGGVSDTPSAPHTPENPAQ
jgi:hypothetical protein